MAFPEDLIQDGLRRAPGGRDLMTVPNFTMPPPTPPAPPAPPRSLMTVPNFTMVPPAPPVAPPAMGPVSNPSFATATSPERAAFERNMATNPAAKPVGVPTVAPVGQGTPNALRSTMGSMLGGTALGAGAAFATRAMQNIGNPANNPGPALREDPLVAQIPTGGYQPAPAAQPFNAFTDTEAGRNIGNLAMALPGVAGGAPIARGAGAISNALGTAETLGAGIAAGVASSRDGLRMPTTSATQPTAAATPTSALIPADGTIQGPLLGAFPTSQTGSATDGIRRIDRPGQSPMFTNAPDGGQFGNDTLAARGPVSAQNMAAADALAGREQAASQARVQGGLRAERGPSMALDTGMSGNMMQRTPAQQRRDAEVQASSILKGTAERGRAGLKSLDEREQVAMREAGANQRAATQAAASMYGADQSLRGNMYGAEQERMSRTAVAEQNARSAKATSEYDQFNKDRSYALDKERFGTEVAEKNRSARAADSKAVDESLQGMFRTRDKDGKDVADTAKVGQYKQALQTTIGALIEQHEASGDPKRVAIAKTLRERGMAAIDPQEHAELKRLFDTRDRARQSTGYMRGGANLVDSDNLLDFQQRPTNGVESRVVGGDRVRLRGGTDMSINDLRYTEPANAVLPDWFKTRDNDLTRGLRMN